ncbi:MAG: hypothetical protein ACRDOU_23800 [Streptosporangiaceae bacterium]
MTSQLSAALHAAAAGIHPDEAAAGLVISHGTFLQRDDFLCHIETAACISDGTPMAWIDWDAVIAALDGGRLPASGGEKRVVRIAASLAAGHPVSLRDAIPGLDSQSLDLVTTAIRRAAGQRQ